MENNLKSISLLSRKMADFILKDISDDPLKILLLCLFSHEEKGYHALNLDHLSEYEEFFQKEELSSFLELTTHLDEMILAFKKNYPHLISESNSPFYLCENYLMTRRNKLLHEEFKERLELRLSTPIATLSLNEEDIPQNCSPSQKEAFLKLLKVSTLFVTGGPGSGKTTLLIHLIKKLIEKLGLLIIVSSPTAKAKNRLLDALEIEDKEHFRSNTLHGLLKRTNHPFKTKSQFTFDCDLLIIDEASMMDLNLFIDVLRHTKTSTRLMIVGDEYQLAPVLSDNVFKSIIWGMKEKNEAFHPFFSELKGQYRQSNLLHQISNSLRGENAPEFLMNLDSLKALNPLSHLEKSIEEIINRYELHQVKESLNFKKGAMSEKILLESLKKLEGFIFLSPIHAKSYGIRHINALFKKKLSPLKFYPGLPIIVNKNNKNLGLSNGDRGLCFQMESKTYFAFHSSKLIIYPAELISDYDEAYCISIHKAQGSEYQEVHIAIAEDSLIGKDALYTAITRSKESFKIYSSLEAIKNILEKREEKNSFMIKKIKEINL